MPYAAGTKFCNLHLQEALIEGHSYYRLTDADSSEKVIRGWLYELWDWLRSEDMEVDDRFSHSRCYHLVSHCINQPEEDMEKLKYFLSLTMIGVRGIDVNDQGKFY